MRTILRIIRDNSLSIVFFLLFLGFLLGQSLSGVRVYNKTQAEHGLPTMGYWRYLGSGTFLDGIFNNWQAAILQLASLILLGGFLHQRGASHSRKPESDECQERQNQRPKYASWIYRNSLSLAFIALFLASFLGHMVYGVRAFNEERAVSRDAPVSFVSFLASAKFWFETLQTWQAEYFAIGAFMILSIFLRQEGSAESKPVESSNEETGETNK